MKNLIYICLIIFALSGCTRSIPIDTYSSGDYTSLIRYDKGSVNLGQFTYEPYESGKLSSNQISAPSIGTYFLDTDISDLVKKVTSVELKRNGIQLNNSDITLVGKVKDISIQIDSDVRLAYKINYQLINYKNNSILLDKNYSSNRYLHTLTDQEFVENINKLIYLGYEKFITDPEVTQILITK